MTCIDITVISIYSKRLKSFYFTSGTIYVMKDCLVKYKYI